MSSYEESFQDFKSVSEFQNDPRSIVTLPRDDFDVEEEAEDEKRSLLGKSVYPEVSKKSLFDIKSRARSEFGGNKSYDDYEDYEEEYQSYRYDFKKLEAAGESFKGTDRDEIIEKLKELQLEANVLVIKNKFLHRHYIEAMKNRSVALKKFDDVIVFEDSRYAAELDDFSRLKDETYEKEIILTSKLDDLKEKFSEAEANYEEIFENLLHTELEVGKKIKPLNLDKKTWNDQLNQMLENQRNRVKSVAKIRMTYLQLYYKLIKLQRDDIESLGPGYSVLDYEFLLKKKDVYEEKLEEQKDHIKNFSHKVLATAAIIKHVDEETDLFTDKVKNAAERLNAISTENKTEHSKFVRLANTRALTFKRILKLREKIGLLGIPFLINKMEYDIIELQNLEKKLKNLEMRMIADQNKFFINLYKVSA